MQLLGGEADRRHDQEQTEAIAAVLAWLAAHPPTAAAGSATTEAIDTPVGAAHGDADRDAAGPPRPAGSAGASTQTRTPGRGGASTP